MTKHIVFFTGNRAEFGIISLAIKACCDSGYKVSVVISGAHTKVEYNTKKEIYESLGPDLGIDFYELSYQEENYYQGNFSENFNQGFALLKILNPDLVVVLGDRVETYGFSNACFFSSIPICHLFGGDVGNVPFFDTNIRHAITKISHLHFVSNQQSYQNVINMGEEKWRCMYMGNISLDKYTSGDFSSRDELIKKYKLTDRKTIVLTYHPNQFEDSNSNFKVFLKVYKVIESLSCQTIITYPNNDEGHERITEFLDHHPQSERIKVIKSLGSRDYLGLLMSMDSICVGNSSSGLYETAFTGTPSINIGDRQTDRPRARNVIDINADDIDLKLKLQLQKVLFNYHEMKKQNLVDKEFFGNGKSIATFLNGLEMFFLKDRSVQLLKKFIIKS